MIVNLGRLALIFILATLSACGSGNESQIGFVTDVRVDPEAVALNQTASLRVDFEPSQDAVFSGDSASLVRTEVTIKLPEGVDYVTDSSEFDGNDAFGFKKRNPNTVEICADGSRALTYSFAPGELTDNENSIRMTVAPFAGQGQVYFYAMADDFISFPCNVISEDFDTLTILP